MRTGRVVAVALFVIAALVAAGCSKSDSASEPSASPAPANRVLGDWHGAIEVPGNPLPVGVSLAEGKGTIDIPTQGVHATALKDVVTQPDRVEFRLADVPGDPVFRGKLDGDKIAGTFSQGGQDLPLSMQRGKVSLPRPQEPKPPFPYQAEDVTYRNGELTIAGTFTKPQSGGPFPTVLLITGSGPQNRDEELLGHRPFLLLADTLTRAGYAVLRSDDRGVGGTGGKLDDANYTDLAGDVTAGVNYLRSRTDVDRTRIGLLGHSEGGFLGPLAASKPDSGVAFVIMMAGPAAKGGDVLVEQVKLIAAAQGATPDKVDERGRLTTELVELLRKGDVAGAKELQRRFNAAQPPDQRVPDSEVGAELTTNFLALVNYDPAPAMSALRVPVLAFYGDKDLQVPPSQSDPAARAALAANPDATVHTFPGLNHLMQPTQTGNPAEYAAIETTIAPEVLTYVTNWLTQRFPAK